jgi:hypothetical protein
MFGEERIPMGDWIDDLKEQEDAEREKRLIEHRAEQERTDRVKELLPGWWTQFVSCLQNRIEKLRAKFPADHSRHLSLQSTPTAKWKRRVTLSTATGSLLEIRILESFPQLEIEHLTLDARSKPASCGPVAQDQFDLGPKGLLIEHGGSECDATELADKIIRDFLNV